MVPTSINLWHRGQPWAGGANWKGPFSPAHRGQGLGCMHYESTYLLMLGIWYHCALIIIPLAIHLTTIRAALISTKFDHGGLTMLVNFRTSSGSFLGPVFTYSTFPIGRVFPVVVSIYLQRKSRVMNLIVTEISSPRIKRSVLGVKHIPVCLVLCLEIILHYRKQVFGLR
jgi:hypothetical protein